MNAERATADAAVRGRHHTTAIAPPRAEEYILPIATTECQPTYRSSLACSLVSAHNSGGNYTLSNRWLVAFTLYYCDSCSLSVLHSTFSRLMQQDCSAAVDSALDSRCRSQQWRLQPPRHNVLSGLHSLPRADMNAAQSVLSNPSESFSLRNPLFAYLALHKIPFVADTVYQCAHNMRSPNRRIEH